MLSPRIPERSRRVHHQAKYPQCYFDFAQQPCSSTSIKASKNCPAILEAKVMRLSASKMTIAFAAGSLSAVEGPAIKQNTPSATSTPLSSPVYYLSNPGSLSAVEGAVYLPVEGSIIHYESSLNSPP